MKDKILKESNGIYLVYGPSASGKTNLSLFLTAHFLKNNKKVVYLDTEKGFTTQRLMDFGCTKKDLDNVFFLKVKNFEDQLEKINLLENIKNISLIVVDSFSVFYRKELHEDYKLTNEKIVSQLRTLKHLSEKTPIILTSQVYSIDDDSIKCVGGDLFSRFCVGVCELVKGNPRKCLVHKPDKTFFNFEIKSEEIIETD